MIWRFAIDVGGTFTDCIATDPAGSAHSLKVLSTGICKGTAMRCPSARSFVDLRRVEDPEGLWVGSECRFFSGQNNEQKANVVAVDSVDGLVTLDRDLACLSASNHETEPAESVSLRYELTMGEPAPLLAIRHVLKLPKDAELPPLELRLGTTRGTNALLTREGATTAFVTTKGFGDALKIGYQDRPDLFDLQIRTRTQLYREVVEIDERLSATGDILVAPHQDDIHRQLLQLKQSGVESVAICLMHAYLNPVHENLVAQIARAIGFQNISTSHEVAPLIKLVSRGQTTVTDAYLNPVLQHYVSVIRSKLSASSHLAIMTSSGDLVAADNFSGKDSLLSGPAGGVVGLARTANLSCNGLAIGFDMGGTSTDVSRFDGTFEMETETTKADVSVYAPTMAIETVAAGGGSICWYESGRLLVGPASAGADPGPACYGRSGPLAVTDLNVWLGRVVPSHFPFNLDFNAIQRRLEEWQQTIQDDCGQRIDLDQLANGWLQIANTRMAEAIRSVSVAKGYDARDYTLVAFGGAAAQHCCAVAEELEMDRVVIPRNAALLSAVGMSHARRAVRQVRGIYRVARSQTLTEFEEDFAALETAGQAQLKEQGLSIAPEVTRIAELRYLGTEAALLLERPGDRDFVSKFEEVHQRRFGYLQDRRIEVCSLQVVVSEPEDQSGSHEEFRQLREIEPVTRQSLKLPGDVVEAGVISRDELEPGDCLVGPALVYDDNSTVVVESRWQAQVLPSGNLELAQTNHEGHGNPIGKMSGTHRELAEPVVLEIFSNHFQAIAEQMGATLRNTSSSVNVKERLDFSCAIFDPDGNLVVNAPHIPVHLGAMSETVRCLIRDQSEMQPGDVFLTNDPYLGGSHLPDLTVISPAFTDDGSMPAFFVASRAHHAEIGGLSPGSMPPLSTRLGEEGVIFRHFKVIDQGREQFEALKHGLAGDVSPEHSERIISLYPSRAPDENVADICAQIAANHQGIQSLLALCQRHGLDQVVANMKQLQHLARSAVADVLHVLGDGEAEFVDQMDDGSTLKVTAQILHGQLRLDFAGTADVHKGNLNANRGIVTAAVLYVLRCLITHQSRLGRCGWAKSNATAVAPDMGDSQESTGQSVPLNHGMLELVELVIPDSMLNPPTGSDPAQSPAVVGGNVETSQRIVDVLLGVFGLAAASQGTMNNLLFGDDSFGYYETICGGSGATCFCSGTDAVHTHMTNTRITDPEVLESRFPVRLNCFCVRQGSGGDGEFAGGNGVIREVSFLDDVDLTLLTNRRSTRPFGLAGGEAGQPGVNQIHTPEEPMDSAADDRWQVIEGTGLFHVSAGTTLRMETPGGGGYGVRSEATGDEASQAVPKSNVPDQGMLS